MCSQEEPGPGLSRVEGGGHPLGSLLCYRREKPGAQPPTCPSRRGRGEAIVESLGLPSCDPATSLPLSLFLFYF